MAVRGYRLGGRLGSLAHRRPVSESVRSFHVLDSLACDNIIYAAGARREGSDIVFTAGQVFNVTGDFIGYLRAAKSKKVRWLGFFPPSL